MAGPLEVSGTVRTTGTRLTIEVDTSSVQNMDATLSNGSTVRMLVWPEHHDGEQLEVDRIAEQQQLDFSTVAQALTSEGALWPEREEFLKRLSLIEM
ncbi:MAG TPA: hypothetical protein VG537_11160 [Candidatus Kapabacteria bacterium]|nr:hypothetical protein [Candidatus Kapabacteria bacterium]